MPASRFSGFTASESFTQVPDSLFRLLPSIDSLEELKVTLYLLWQIEHSESRFPYLCQSDIEQDKKFMAGFSAEQLKTGLIKAVKRGTLLVVENADGGFYFINSPRGKASAEALQKGNWRGSAASAPTEMQERPNIFKIYEENIGPLTPLIADALKDAEETYSSQWLADAMQTAVQMNKRNWKYIEAILKRWKEEGRAEEQNRRDHQKDDSADVLDKVEAFRRRK